MFDLRKEPWIPWLYRSGDVAYGTVAQLVVEGDDAVVGVAFPRPDLNGAFLEFAIGLLSAALAAADEDEWLEIWGARLTVEWLQERLDRLPAAFDLEGENGPAFFQDYDPAAFAGKEALPVERLFIDSPGEQGVELNTTLFVKPGRFDALSRAMASAAIIALQTYSPAGGAGNRTSMRGGGPLTTLVDPRIDPYSEPLWKLLWFNAETREQWRNRVDIDSPEGDSLRYPWLAPTRTSEKGQFPVTPRDTDPLQAYFGMPRRLRLVYGDQPARCALSGITDERPVVGVRSRNYGVNYEGWVHPLSPYYTLPSGELSAMHPQPSGFQWKDWVDMALVRPEAKRRPAKVVAIASRRLQTIGIDESRLMVFGYDCDNAKTRGWLQAAPPFFRGDAVERQWLAKLAEELGAAVDAAGFALAGAIVTAQYGDQKDAPRVGDPYRQRLWAITESLFFSALSAARQAGLGLESVSAARRTFFHPLRRAVLDLFEEAAPVGGVNVMGVRRIARASHYLEGTLAGYGKTGAALYTALNLTPPEVPKGRTKKAAGKGVSK